MSTDTKRLLLEFEQQMRRINRDTLNPMIEELNVEDLRPVIRMVALARGAYIKELISIAKAGDGEIPADRQIASLQLHRKRYDELVSAAQALEAAIQRGYLDVQGSA